MEITLTNILLGEITSINQTMKMFWKKSSEPDGDYRALPDAIVSPLGVIISPSPYIFTTEGTTLEDIDVKAVNDCDEDFVFVKVFEGLDMCCEEGFTLSPDGLQCSQTLTVAPTVTQSGICVACSQLSPQYGGATKFWAGFNYDQDLQDANFVLLNTPYWGGNPTGSGATIACGDSSNTPGSPPSPVNRQGVWIDSNCDGVKNALSIGAALQFTWVINSPTAQTVYVGMSGDNNFTLTHNGTIVVARTNNADTDNFFFLFLFPIQLISGTNYINAKFVGDGSTSDMGCMIIIDNDPASILGISADNQISYLFQTSQMIGAQPIDIASCPPDYSLDTSGGSGNYICVQVNTVASTPC